MCMLRKVSCFMIAVAILVAVPAVWEIGPSGPACPGALGAAEICLWPDQYGQMYTATLYPEPFGGKNGSALLVGILSASAAILAITFTLNQIMLSTISQRYSYRIAQLSTKKPTRAFEAFLLLVAGSAALLLVYDSSPAWLVAYAVLIATGSFFIALWFFARGFVDIMQAMYPPNFIKNAKNKILADIRRAGCNDVPVQYLSEQSGDMVKSLGDTATKSLIASDMDICMACIDVLHDTSKEFLDRKRDRTDKHKDTQDLLSDPSRNVFVSHVAEQFVRIVNKSAEIQDSQVMRYALEKFYAMTKLAIEDPNNADVIKILYETHDRSGSPWWRFVDKLTDIGTKSDKNYIVQYLLDLTVAAMDSHHVPFVKEFITYHIFRSVRTIIDKNDFELFKKVIHLFSYSGSFMCSEEMHRFVQSQILSGRSGLLDPGTSALRDKIAFELNNSAKRDFGRIPELKKEVELFLAQTQSNEASETAPNDADRKTLRYMDRLHACSLLWGTFFRLACHIIGKGDEYSAYLRELWHHTNPPEQPYRSANAPPCSKDVDWNSLYPGWAGRGDLDDLELIDEPITYKPHYYKYAVLHMLRDDKIWHVPGDSEIDRWGQNDSLYKLEHYYEIVRNIKTERFLEALDSLAGSKLPAEMLPGIDVRARIEIVRKQLESFRENCELVAERLAAQMPIDDAKKQEWKGEVHKEYFNYTKAHAVARIKYDMNLDVNDPLVTTGFPLPHRALVRKGDVLLPGDLGSWSAAAEFEKILSTAEDGAVLVTSDTENPLDAIKAGVRKMRDGGHKPRAVILSQDDEYRILSTDPVAISGGTIDVDGSPVQIVEAPESGQPGTTLIIDPDCIQVAYKAEDEAGRLLLDVPDQDKAEVTMTSTIPMSVKILDGGGVAKIAPADA